MRALYTAATGMTAQQQRLDTIANNLANVSTTGFKKSRDAFQDLFYQSLTGNSAQGGLRLELGGRQHEPRLCRRLEALRPVAARQSLGVLFGGNVHGRVGP